MTRAVAFIFDQVKDLAASLTISACLGGSRRPGPVTPLRAESTIAANVMTPHHRQTPPEERGMKRMKGGFAVTFIFGGLDG
jgi:hypothetical protein